MCCVVELFGSVNISQQTLKTDVSHVIYLGNLLAQLLHLQK